MKASWSVSSMLVLAVVFFIEVATPTEIFAQTGASWRLEFDNSIDPVTTGQLDVWEKQANDGDLKLQRQFAEAFVIHWFGSEGDCSHLKYGHRCRAMQTRLAVGEKFARQTAELLPPEEDKYGLERSDIAYFQRWYGEKRFRDAAPEFDPESKVCKESVRFLSFAVVNGQKCAAERLGRMAYWGRCLQQNREQAIQYYSINAGCPRY